MKQLLLDLCYSIWGLRRENADLKRDNAKLKRKAEDAMKDANLYNANITAKEAGREGCSD